MKRLGKFVLLGVSLALLAALVLPLAAQEEGGQGGIIVEGNLGGDPATFNPLVTNDTASQLVASLLFPNFVGIDPETTVFTPGADGALATDWTISDDGTVYTFTLRDDWTWSDGTPITSADVAYGFNVIASGQTGSPLGYVLDFIQSVEAPDPQTVVITFNSAACNNINNASYLPIVPAHVMENLTGGDFAAIDTLEWNLAPDVTAGPFAFGEFRPSEQVGLIADQNYPDAQLGYVNPTGWVYKNVPDENVMNEQFLAGELTLNSPPLERYEEFRERVAAGEFQSEEWSANSYNWIAWNLADPSNPQNGLDENGDPIEQGHHPIFGDVRVRQAFAMGVNIDDIIQGAAFGQGTRVNTASVPTSWAYNPDIAGIPYDPEAASALLTEAGWIDDDNDPSTPRVAQGALYAEDGTVLEFDLITNSGNVTREAIGTVVQDQLGQIGARVNFQPIDFNVAIEQMTGQTYDAVILGWSLSFPDDPDFSFAFAPQNDVVGAGFNFVSYNNPEVTNLLNQANNLPGCDPTERAALYQQAQALLAEDQPYMFLFSATSLVVAQPNLQNFSPYPNQTRWNIDTWALTP
jgi:peptide/nickel transport system substrate-binding protein